MTITEALAEIKLIEKKIESKKNFVLVNLTRFKNAPDVLSKENKTSSDVLKGEMQAIHDLYSRLIKIRTNIAEANLANFIDLGGESHSIHHWLSWKREVSEKYKELFASIHRGLKSAIDSNGQRPQIFKDETGGVHLCELITNLDYQEYVKKHEETQDMIEKLDGLLSLKNAVVHINL